MNRPMRPTGEGTLWAPVGRFLRRLRAVVSGRAAGIPAPAPSAPDDGNRTEEGTARSEPRHLSLRLGSLDDIIRETAGGPAAIERLVAYRRVTVDLPPLRIGAEALDRVAVRENEQHIAWQQTSYLSLPTAAYAVGNALVHGSAGLIGIGDRLVAETTWHTEPGRHRYRLEGAAIGIAADRVPILSGTHLSLLTPGGNSYWHAVVDGVAKVSILPDAVMDRVQTILFSSDAIGQETFLRLCGLPGSIALRPVQPSETFRVETLILPWDLHGVFDYHPVINRFFDRVLAHHAVDGTPRIERLYVDRRGSTQRRLLNEDGVVAVLEAMGFVPVRLEDLTIDRQITLFRQATVIVSPHGAGLTNIGFASPGCIVIELMMDAYLNWCFRRIAGLRKLIYGCVIGTARRPWADLNPGFHNQVWEVRVEDVRKAVERALSERPSPRS